MNPTSKDAAMFDVPGAFEVLAARRFFGALAARDIALLLELLHETPSFENVDGPMEVAGRVELARTLAGHADDVEYQLADVEASPGLARVRFILLVEGVPGGIVLEAVLRFVERRIHAIRVAPPAE
jgi:hypothetical protein